MIVLYTSSGCGSCRKAKQWFKDKNIKYIEKNLFTTLLTEDELGFLLSRSENGTDDIISKRSKVIKDNNIDIDSMPLSELISFVQQNPSVLKRPIILNEKSMVVGYDESEIEIFDQQIKNLRFECLKDSCPNYQVCGKCRVEDDD